MTFGKGYYNYYYGQASVDKWGHSSDTERTYGAAKIIHYVSPQHLCRGYPVLPCLSVSCLVAETDSFRPSAAPGTQLQLLWLL